MSLGEGLAGNGGGLASTVYADTTRSPSGGATTTAAAILAGDGTITLHGSAGFAVPTSGKVRLLVVSGSTTEVMLATAGVTGAAGDQTVTVTRAGALGTEVGTAQTAQAFPAGAAVYQVVTPGLLAELTPAKQLGYQEIATATHTGDTNFADITGSSITVTIGTKPVMVEIAGPLGISAGGPATYGFQVLDVTAGNVAVIFLGSASTPSLSGLTQQTWSRQQSPAAGTRTYKAQFRTGTGTATVNFGGTHAHIRVYEVAT